MFKHNLVDPRFTPVGLCSSRDDKIKGGYDRAASLKNTLAELQTGGNLILAAGEDLTLVGVKTTASGDATLKAGGDVTIASVQDTSSRDLKLDIKTRGFLGTQTNIRREASASQTQASTVTAGEDISITAETGDVALDATRLKSGDETLLQAQEGQVALLSETDASYRRDFKREKDLLWWNERDQGQLQETIRHVEIEAGGGLTIDAGNGVVVEYKQTGNLEASLDQLSQSPGLSWIGELRNDPVLAGKVDWQAVDAQFQQWDYKSQGLTEAGAALVTLVTTALTAGAGGLTASLSGNLASSLGIQNVAMQTALKAGVQTLINTSAVSLVDNRGDLAKTLKALGSSASLRSLATAMVTAGLTTQIAGAAGIGPDLPVTAPLAERVVQDLQRGLIRASVSASVSTVIEGGSLDRVLVDNLRLAASDTLGAVVAQEIGAAYRGGKIDVTSQLIAHAALGCATGAIASGDCGAGAAGAFSGEVAAKLQIQQWSEAKLKQYASLQGRQLTPDEAAALRTSLEADFDAFKGQGVDVARLAGGLAAALTGGDVDTGANTGGNAAENNAFFVPVVIALIIAGGYATVEGEGDPITGVDRILAGEDTLTVIASRAMQAGVELSYAVAPHQTQVVLEGLAAGGDLANQTIVYIDDKTGNVVSGTWDSFSPPVQQNIRRAGFFLGAAAGAGVSAGVGRIAAKVTLKGTGEAMATAKKLANANRSGSTPGGDDLLPNSRTRVLTEAEARGLAGENKGLIYVAETPRGPVAAQEFQAGTTGAFSDIGLRKGGVPALRYTNPNANGRNFVKFDGIEKAADGSTILLIDAKTRFPFERPSAINDIRDTMGRVKAALEQNPGYKVVYEFPDIRTANDASKFLERENFSGLITVRTRGQ